MKLTLAKMILAPVVIAAAAFTANASTAAITNIKVPFTFTVAGKACPAGVYSVERDALHGTVTLRSQEAPRSFSFLLGPAPSETPNSKVILSFDQTGDNHELRTVQYRSLITARLDDKKGNEHRPTQIVQGQ